MCLGQRTPKKRVHTCFYVIWFKCYVSFLPDGGRLGFMGQNYVITWKRCQNQKHHGRCTRKIVFMHAFRYSGSNFQSTKWRPFWVYGSKWCLSVKLMPESASSWTIYLKNCIHTRFLALWFKCYYFVMVPTVFLDFALWRKMPAFFRGSEGLNIC